MAQRIQMGKLFVIAFDPIAICRWANSNFLLTKYKSFKGDPIAEGGLEFPGDYFDIAFEHIPK